jgi:hypothetical protein
LLPFLTKTVSFAALPVRFVIQHYKASGRKLQRRKKAGYGALDSLFSAWYSVNINAERRDKY